MNKVFISASLAVTILFASCGGSSESSEETKADGTTETEASSESTADETSAGDDEIIVAEEPADDEIIVAEEPAEEGEMSAEDMTEGTSEEASESNASISAAVEEVAANTESTSSSSTESAKTETTKAKTTTTIAKPELSHKPFDELLKKYVTSSGAVNYGGFKKERAKLDKYIESLSANYPKSNWSKNKKLAYWINVYNAFTIRLILDKWPVKSIMDINGGKAWDLKYVKLGSHNYTLNDVEHKIIRPTFKDARIHFAVNCAASSCPKLLNGAWFESTLDKQLDKATKLFVNNTAKNKITAKSVQVSKIFEWYGEDFGSLITYLNKYSNTTIKSNAKITYMDYDWALNKQ